MASSDDNLKRRPFIFIQATGRTSYREMVGLKITIMDHIPEYVPARKSGRAFNGSHNDAGTIIHLVPPIEGNGDWFTRALCGSIPGYRGNGWSKVDGDATCPKCINKMQKFDRSCL